MSRPLRAALLSAIASTAAALTLATPAFAHVSTTPSEAPAKGYATVFFQVPHGCNGAATTKVAIQIPEGVSSVKPEAVAGWTAASVTTPLATPITVEGKEVTTRISEVTWTGGPLANDQFQRFGVTMKLPDKAAGTDIMFPTIQTCTTGSTSWTDVVEKGKPEPAHPAPMITLTKATADGHGSESAHDATSSTDHTATTVAWIALGLGAGGLVLGFVALLTAMRKKATNAA
jgi:uncharacterized protein YcnI